MLTPRETVGGGRERKLESDDLGWEEERWSAELPLLLQPQHNFQKVDERVECRSVSKNTKYSVPKFWSVFDLSDNLVHRIRKLASSSSRKRKGKEVVVETAAPPPPTINFFPPAAADQQHQYHQRPFQINNPASHNAPPLRRDEQMVLQRDSMPFTSFTSLLTQGEHDQDHRLANTQIDHIVQAHSESLRRNLAHALRGAEERKERVMEKMSRRIADLEAMMMHYKVEAQFWQARAKTMEQAAGALQEAIMSAGGVGGVQRTVCVRCGGGGGGVGGGGQQQQQQQQEDDAESSFVDPERAEPARMPCKVCGRRAATVMMWPCRHVCICKRCDDVTKNCPECHSPNTTSVDVNLPPQAP
ncbi:hypothetical protein RJ640_026209 [Escallonia rubra]|uniref:RING-type domain-containing protein n=1 Tax=Escallonia rubra TaxID=112253 RepID=A0AA88RTC3_9ASTE|nr:hypothetical protein RJ640_026209 [Escallonia rubra]